MYVYIYNYIYNYIYLNFVSLIERNHFTYELICLFMNTELSHFSFS